LFDKYKKAIKVDIFAFRYEAQDKAELFSDFLRALDFVIRIYPQIKYSVKVNHIYFPATKSSIRIFGITTKNMKRIKKTGLSHSSAEYIFKFFEERAEFGGADIQDVNEAVRGVGKYKMTTFSASNPRTLSNEYIA
jgi:ArsR family metal-binding transcriptional regulator